MLTVSRKIIVTQDMCSDLSCHLYANITHTRIYITHVLHNYVCLFSEILGINKT